MKNWTVYEHISPSGKVYIGITSAKYISQRFHRGLNYKSCKKFYCAIEVNSKILFLVDSTNRVVKTYKSQVTASVDLNVSQWKISVYKDTDKEIIKGCKLVTKLKE